MYKRLLTLSLSAKESCFLWGARQSGKSTLLKTPFPDAAYYDLLLSAEYRRLINDPGIVREECLAAGLRGETQKTPVIIDEIQKVPELVDEVHWLIENRGIRFILCGSSARKLKRGHGNLLGGRAIRYELFPLVSAEIGDFSLSCAVNSGLLPRLYSHSASRRLIQSYVGDYLKEEIAAEAVTRNIPAFSRFLEIAAMANGEMINFTNIASECGVSSPTVKEYYQILVDTLIGRFVPAYRKRAKRRMIHASRFHFFDVGVVSYLTRRGKVEPGSELFGKAFEHFIVNEIIAHASYSELFYPIAYWRTTSGFEVDLILDDGAAAIEIKSTAKVNRHHLKGIRSLKDEHEYNMRRYLVVSLDPNPRKTEDGIEILPWAVFLERLWAGEIIQ